MKQEANDNIDAGIRDMAAYLTSQCLHTDFMQKHHEGFFPESESKDYSDVKVKTVEGEIAWKDLARISDDELAALGAEMTEKIYTFLSFWLSRAEGADRDAVLRTFGFAAQDEWSTDHADEDIIIPK